MGERRSFWRGAGGGAEVLEVAYPLILGQMTFTIQTFVNRLFLTWYSPEALAGAMTGLFVAWTVIGFFSVTAEYLTTFVAQYIGAGHPDRVGAVVWQGVYFSAAAGLVLAGLSPFIGYFFQAAGHDPVVMGYEVAYSRILYLGAFPIVLVSALSTFFAGRGETGVVLRVTLLTTAFNTVLDYLWIFGHGGFPRLGVTGAALATVASEVFASGLFFALVLRPEHRRTYSTASAWRLEVPLLRRLLSVGIPSGLQVSIEIFAFALFMLIVGRIGTDALAASSIAFNLNMIFWMPMVGLGVGVSSLVGRYLGAGNPDLAERSVFTAFGLSLVYMGVCASTYVFWPRLLLSPYAAGSTSPEFESVLEMAVVLLRFVAIYSIFDTMNIVFAAGLKGAGDTRYPLAATLTLSSSTMLLPAYVACVRMGKGVYVAWSAASTYVILLGIVLMLRFRAGRWRTLRVIEPEALLHEGGGGR